MSVHFLEIGFKRPLIYKFHMPEYTFSLLLLIISSVLFCFPYFHISSRYLFFKYCCSLISIDAVLTLFVIVTITTTDVIERSKQGISGRMVRHITKTWFVQKAFRLTLSICNVFTLGVCTKMTLNITKIQMSRDCHNKCWQWKWIITRVVVKVARDNRWPSYELI